ncbi:MAG: proline--tRNA ligase [Prolixibacteraceae bacterium]|nr:proline--tRNA ligase [Prolixibacteraceae bacterium]
MAKITKQSENFSKWYTDVILEADLADYGPVKGTMVIKPYGYSLWTNVKNILNTKIVETGHENAYFPLFIPKSFLEKEAKHVEGFAKECAVVTHSKLISEDGTLTVDPNSKLDEEIIVRPTSETIIWHMFKKWVTSYRDLPIKINQWANVVRWEMRTRLFLRTAEFLWQEGHTAHATKQEAIEETEKIINIYADFAENFMAMPVIKGLKSESERFAGALETYSIEALMQDGKALQSGTSHFLGQNFAKAFDVKFASKEGKEEYVWATSWGVSTRLMGALIMAHSDDNGLVLPPKLAPFQVVIVPIYRNEEQLDAISEKVNEIISKLKARGISVKYDSSDNRKPGWKFAQYELKGVPVRLAIGPRDLENGTVEVARRDTLEKSVKEIDGIDEYIETLLDKIQSNIYTKAFNFRKENTSKVETYDAFKIAVKKGGFVLAHWDGTAETEERIKSDTKATIRCLPLEYEEEEGVCIYSGKPSKRRVLFALAY